MKNLYRIITFVACVGLFSQCAQDGEYEHPINRDNHPDVPIMFTGATTHGANPYYLVKFAGTATPVTINIAVGGESGRTIKEITKVVAGTTSITPGNVVGATSVTGFLASPVSVNGASVTISTTVADMNTYIAGTVNDVTQNRVDAAAAATPATPFLEYAFMFLVTLDDGTTIITQQCRLRFVK